jgi:hypothetical protein
VLRADDGEYGLEVTYGDEISETFLLFYVYDLME